MRDNAAPLRRPDRTAPAAPIIRSISYGGGVQSTALLVLAAQGVIDFNLFLMSNVGDDSEHPATLDYVHDVAAPYAAEHGIELVVLSKTRKDGSIETLYDKITRPGSNSASIPYRSKPDGPPMSRSCTVEFKMRVIGRELKRHGATGGRACNDHAVPARCLAHQSLAAKSPCRFHPAAECDACVPANLATVGIGISLDEIGRANRSPQPYENIVYPLVGIGEETGLKLRRDDCLRIIRDAGLPVPPKSSCYFCPFHSAETWADMRRDEPELFDKAADLETHLRDRSVSNGTGPVFLTRFGIPLRDAIDSGQDLLPLADDGACDSGWCFT